VGLYDDSIGRHGFVDNNGVFTPLDPPQEFGSGAYASGINKQGVIVGVIGEHGFVEIPTKK
jgi:hypothetical protein